MEINATLIGQLITFILLVWFTMKYVWPPITKIMQEREKKIAEGLEDAERSKRELEKANHKAADIIRHAKIEATQIVDVAHKRAAQVVEESKETAREESRRILDLSKEEIQREVSQAKEVLRKQFAGLAVAGAEKIIRRNLDVNTQASLLDEFVSEI